MATALLYFTKLIVKGFTIELESKMFSVATDGHTDRRSDFNTVSTKPNLSWMMSAGTNHALPLAAVGDGLATIGHRDGRS